MSYTDRVLVRERLGMPNGVWAGESDRGAPFPGAAHARGTWPEYQSRMSSPLQNNTPGFCRM